MADIVQAVWIGRTLSTLERLCAASFLANHHEFHLYVYHPVENVPNGVLIKDARAIVPESEIFMSNNSLGAFTDLFRWELLYKCGHYYIDMDVVCLRTFDFEDDIVFGKQAPRTPGTAVIRFPKGHAFARFMVDVCRAPNRFLPYDSWRDRARKICRYLLGNQRGRIRWGETGGPDGFGRALRYFNLFNLGKPFTCFYPVHYSDWRSVFDGSPGDDARLYAHTYALHLWNEMIRREKTVDKDAAFPPHSLIEQLKRRYLC